MLNEIMKRWKDLLKRFLFNNFLFYCVIENRKWIFWRRKYVIVNVNMF